MDDRQVRLLTVLSAAVLAVALIWWLAPRRDDPAWDAGATVSVWDLDPERVTRLVVEQPERERLVVEERGDGWILVEPTTGPADTLKVEAALDTLADVEVGVPVTEADADELGLGDPPRARVTVTTPAGEQVLAIGDAAPVGWQTYLRTPAGEQVVVPVLFDRDIVVDPWSLRDATVLDFPLSDVVRAELHSPAGTLVVTRDDADLWWLQGYGRASLADVDNLFLSLAELRLDQFLDGVIEGDIEDPRHRVVVGLRDGRTVEARFGDTLPYGRLVRASSGAVGTILQERLALLDQGPTDLLDDKAFPVGGSRVDRIEVSLAGRSTTIEGGPGRWKARGLSSADTLALVEALRQAGIDRRGEVPEALPETTGRVRIREGDRRTRLIEVGPVDGRHRLVRDVSGGPVYRVPEVEIQAIVERLPEG